MASKDRTPTERPTGEARALCPHCNERRRVTVAGLFELHTVVGKWSRRMCRGSGQPAV